MRRRPALHPDGLVISGTVDVTPPGGKVWAVPLLDEPGRYEAVVRWSRAAGLPSPLPDGMGLAVRVLDAGGGRPFDVLLTSSGTARLTRHLPLPRRHATAPYSTLTSYRFPDRERVIVALPVAGERRLPADLRALAASLKEGPVRYRLCAAAAGEAWRPFATLTLRAGPEPAPQAPLAFDPYVNCLADLPPGRALRALREAAYDGSRRGRAAVPQGEPAPRHGLTLAAFAAYSGGWALLVRRRGHPGEGPVALPELLVTAAATFRLTRLLGKAKVTRPLRAPFTEVEEEGAPAELNEVPKAGHPTVGALLTCPFCLGVWVATALTAARMVWPRATSAAVRTLAAVAVSDALHLGYTALVDAAEADEPSA
ncbi:DUF1360 domain-containing protein [Streptomyces sp. NPDC048352]|uniref:DUF1360 domain-containing protein n=1 Tax=Streptomyces sp. NPDC048352 TaxID=3154718 RepID=UPI00342F92B7